MKFNACTLNGAFILDLPAFKDERGVFSKCFQDSVFRSAGIDFVLRESYFSLSARDVIRGMHFQLPPHQHSKIVYCPQGAILDVIVDLRRDSSTYGQCEAQELSAENHKAFYIPEGFAHGFRALTDDALTCYLVSSEYSRDHDTGIRYDSFGFDWQTETPLLSARDLSFDPLAAFVTRFDL